MILYYVRFMSDFLDSPKKWSANNANLIIGFLFGLAVPFTAWILLLGFFKIKSFNKTLSLGAAIGLPFGILSYSLLLI